MTASNILKTIMKLQGLGQTALGKRIGVKNDAVYQRLRQDNISIKALSQMLGAMDYKVIVVPADRRVRDDEYEVTIEEPSKQKPKPIDLDSILPPKP